MAGALQYHFGVEALESGRGTNRRGTKTKPGWSSALGQPQYVCILKLNWLPPSPLHERPPALRWVGGMMGCHVMQMLVLYIRDVSPPPQVAPAPTSRCRNETSFLKIKIKGGLVPDAVKSSDSLFMLHGSDSLWGVGSATSIKIIFLKLNYENYVLTCFCKNPHPVGWEHTKRFYVFVLRQMMVGSECCLVH